MAKRPIIPQAKDLTEEICNLVVEYVKLRRAKRKMWKKDFIEDVGFSTLSVGNLNGERKRGCMNINTACILLDAIGYELKVVKKEDNKIVRLHKERLGNNQ